MDWPYTKRVRVTPLYMLHILHFLHTLHTLHTCQPHLYMLHQDALFCTVCITRTLINHDDVLHHCHAIKRRKKNDKTETHTYITKNGRHRDTFPQFSCADFFKKIVKYNPETMLWRELIIFAYLTPVVHVCIYPTHLVPNTTCCLRHKPGDFTSHQLLDLLSLSIII